MAFTISDKEQKKFVETDAGDVAITIQFEAPDESSAVPVTVKGQRAFDSFINVSDSRTALRATLSGTD